MTPSLRALVNVNLLVLLACRSFTVNAFSVGQRQSLSSCFVTPPQRAGISRAGVLQVQVLPASRLFSSQDDDADVSESTSRRKRRVRRKESSGDNDTDATEKTASAAPEAAAPEAAAPAVDLRPRESAAPLQVRDIRDLAGTGGAPVKPASSANAQQPSSSVTVNKFNAPGGAGSNKFSSDDTGNLEDSLAELLADARNMQVKEDQDMQDAGETKMSMPKTIRNVISTILTADFFAVCFFLLWFLLGIAVRSIAKDDSIQIAFNNQFQTLVQPALGLLMVGSVAGAVFPDPDEEGMM
jgi:hypothetical protein